MIVGKKAISILVQVAHTSGLTPEKIVNCGNIKEALHANNVAIYRMREEARLSFFQIGTIMAKDSVTVIHGYYQIKREHAHKEDRL